MTFEHRRDSPTGIVLFLGIFAWFAGTLIAAATGHWIVFGLAFAAMLIWLVLWAAWLWPRDDESA